MSLTSQGATAAGKNTPRLDGRGRPITRLTASDDLPSLLTVAEAAQWCGVHADTIRGLITSGGLPQVRFGRLVRVPKATLLAMMAKGQEGATDTGNRR